MKLLKTFTCLLMVIVATNVVAGSFEAKKYEFGIAPGVLFPGKVYISLHGDNVKQKAISCFGAMPMPLSFRNWRSVVILIIQR